MAVRGAFGKNGLTTTFPVPTRARSLQRTILTRGDGAITLPGQWVVVALTFYDGRTGEQVNALRGAVQVRYPSPSEGFHAAYRCVPLGSRVVTTFPASALYGPAGTATLGIRPHDSIVVVTDVVGLERPPVPAAWPDAPAVRFDADGVPHLRLAGSPPSDLRLHVLRKGDGPVVRLGDDVTATYEVLSWDTREVVDDSAILSPSTIGTQGMMPGLDAGLVGQRVGSRVIVTVPPKYGVTRYVEGGTDLRGQSLVLVINILGISTT